MIDLINGDSREELPKLAENRYHAVISDPPYGLVAIPKRFGKVRQNMVKEYPNGEPTEERKGPFVRLNRGFLNQKWDGTGIEKDPSFWAEVLRVLRPGGFCLAFSSPRTAHLMIAAMEEAGFLCRNMLYFCHASGFPKYLTIDDGWGTELKPAVEPIAMMQKPISEKTIKANWERWQTAAINFEACRLPNGKFPAHLMHDGILKGLAARSEAAANNFMELDFDDINPILYYPKPTTAEKDEGLGKEFAAETTTDGRNVIHESCEKAETQRVFGCKKSAKRNTHPTPKNITLMSYLCRMVTVHGGEVLDPFMGSGSTGVGAVGNGFGFTGIEGEEKWFKIAKARIEHASSRLV